MIDDKEVKKRVIEGFCFHCADCEVSFLFAERAIAHSVTLGHGVRRKKRIDCFIHGKN